MVSTNVCRSGQRYQDFDSFRQVFVHYLISILIICNKQVAKFLRTPFLQFTYGRLLLKFVEYLSLESFFLFGFLDKSTFLHRRCLMLKFSEVLILVCRKIFSAFYPILHEAFSILYKKLIFSLLT